MMIILWTIKVGSSDIFYNRISNRQQKIVNALRISTIKKKEVTNAGKDVEKGNSVGM